MGATLAVALLNHPSYTLLRLVSGISEVINIKFVYIVCVWDLARASFATTFPAGINRI